jgi:hypothetical protein
MREYALLYALIFFALSAIAGLVVHLVAHGVWAKRLGCGLAVASTVLVLLGVALIVLVIVLTTRISYVQ